MTSQARERERMTADLLRDRWGLSVKSEFVPFSKSRNAGEVKGKGPKDMSLNWRVTLQKDGQDLLTTDYSAGIGHCPSYKQTMNRFEAERVVFECERGRRAFGEHFIQGKGSVLEPDAADVVYGLLMDASALDSPTYEQWAGEFGYDKDSRKGEAIYRACLEIALKLRAALGERVLSELREAFQDY